jgi:hypothetical protein
MKAFETIERIAGTRPSEIAERCNISLASAKAVRAAARLSLEDRKAGLRRLAASGQKRSPGSGESLAAEAAPEYGDRGL